jgi:hypothetical protein
MAGALCAAVAVLVAVVAAFSARSRRRHRARMQQWAESNGWTYTPQPAVDWGRRLPGGNKNGITEAFSRVVDGRQVSVAEYSVTDASDGTSTNTHWYVATVAVLRRSLPASQVEPRSLPSRLRSARRGLDEVAVGHPDFDRGFRIRTSDPARLRHWFSPSLVAAHQAGQVPPAWSVHGTEVLRWQPGRLNPENLGGLTPGILILADLLDG